MSDSQRAKAKAPIAVTLFGMVTEARLLHPENAERPILVTPSGITREVRPEQP